jgi:GT2 family glycosyltransferase
VNAGVPPGTADLGVIIVNWNTRDLLRTCLTSVFASDRLTLEVWVVDNASTDGSRETLENSFPAVRWIANDENVGFARANNQALARITSRHVLLLNSDTEVQGGALATLVEFMDANAGVGAAGPRLLNPDGSLQPSGREFPSLITAAAALVPLPSAIRRAIAPRLERRDYDQVAEVDELSGAALCLRRAALDQVGMLDEHFFFLGEDVDLCWRLHEAGWSIRYVPAARIVHVWGASRARGSERIRMLTQRAYVRLFRKHRPGVRAQAITALAAASTVARAAIAIGACGLRGDGAGAAARWRESREQLAWLGSS